MPGPATPPPPTRRDDLVETLHGHTIADPYRWLEDEHSPEVQAWMTAQDEHARAYLSSLRARAALSARMKALLEVDALGAPRHRRGRYFWVHKHAAREKSIVYWRDGDAGEARVLFDPNAWSADGSSSLGEWTPSHDGARVAYNRKENNADEAVMHVRDVAAGTDTGDVIPGTKYAQAAWTPDGRGFYYVWVPPVGGDVTVADRPGFAEVRFHRLGDDPATDEIVRPATRDAQTFQGVDVSHDGRWLIHYVQHGWNATDLEVLDLHAATPAWIPLAHGGDALFTAVAHAGTIYVLTNDGAPRFRVLAIDPAHPAREAWREVVAEDPVGTLESMSVVGGHLVLTWLRRAASALEVRTLAGAPVREIALPGVGTVSNVVGVPDEDTLYFVYSSFTEPGVVFATSIASGGTSEWSRVTVPLDTSTLVTEQVSYRSKDGTEISMFLIRGKGTRPRGDVPTILYGYGGFSVSLTPTFSASRVVWAERGGIVAIPNLRGGGEYGEAWHQAGMLDRKQNVFDDYLAAAAWLCDQGWTSPAHLAIHGGSNGGLLVGAAMTQAPAQFGAVVCAVPLLDMVRYHRFGSGKTWVPEYGSPDDPAQLATLVAYSPYHRVVPGTPYPAMLMLAADSDDRVDPMHARKFTAAVQAATTSDAPVVLRIERNAGHGGADKMTQAIAQAVDMLAFLLATVGGPAQNDSGTSTSTTS
jgi:prolyl oligopeptidase